MQTLWAPWRMTYILGEDKPKACIFCSAQDKIGDDNLVVTTGQFSLVMMNKFPYNNAHLLIAPRRHINQLEKLQDDEYSDLMHFVRLAIISLTDLMNPEGFNVGLNLGQAAGAGIKEHLHFHVVPRWNGDTNFMTVLAEIRSIPEHILITKEKLKPYFDKIL